MASCDGALLQANRELQGENTTLRAQVELLEAKLRFFETHPTIARGIQGESLVAKLLQASRAHTNAEFDVLAGAGRIRIEVKFSRLNTAVKGRRKPTLRWTWANIFGESGHKQYDRLILVGEKDPRHLGKYSDAQCPYVFFDVPFDEAQRLCLKGTRAVIQLTSNPMTAKSIGAALFDTYQTTVGGLEERYDVNCATDVTELRGDEGQGYAGAQGADLSRA